MDAIRDLEQEAYRAYEDWQRLHDKIVGEKRNATKEEQRELDRLWATWDRKKRQVDRAHVRSDLRTPTHDRVTAADPTEGMGANGGAGRRDVPGSGIVYRTEEGHEVRSLTRGERLADRLPAEFNGVPAGEIDGGRWLRAVILGDWSGAEAEKRALGGTTGAGGGFLAPEIVASQWIDLARNAAVCFQAGAQSLPMESETLRLAKVTSDPTAYWTEENATITASDPGLGAVTLTARKIAIRTIASLELLSDASNAADMLKTIIGRALAVGLDAAGLMGTGVGSPRGIYYTDGVNEELSVGTPTDYTELSNAYHECLQDNEYPNACVYSARSAKTYDQLKDGNGNPLVVLPSIAGIRRLVTNAMPDTLGSGSDESAAIVGDFSKLLFGLRTPSMELRVSTEAGDAFKKFQAEIRGVLRVSSAVLRPAAFCVAKGITA